MHNILSIKSRQLIHIVILGNKHIGTSIDNDIRKMYK